MIEKITQKLKSTVEKLEAQGLIVINLYVFGSHVYGTADELSDWDFIAVVEKMPQTGKYLIDAKSNRDFHFYTKEKFQLELDLHNLQLLECYFNPEYSKIENHQFHFTLDKYKLRQAISSMMQNSWVKGRKKLVLREDYDLRIGLKSLFHSIKTCGYGIQIATQGKITDFGEYNWFLSDIKNLSQKFERDRLWKEIKLKYKQKLYNNIRTHFKNLCPKEDLNSKRQDLKKLFKIHKVKENMDLINDIINELK